MLIGGVAVTSRHTDVLVGARRAHHRHDVAAIINANPNHPMHAMLDPHTVGTANPEFITQPYGQGGKLNEDWLRHPEDWQSGHVRTGHTGDADVLVVQTRYRNMDQSYKQETGGRGQVVRDHVVVIDGIAVEGQSAWDLWHHGFIDLSYDQMENLPILPM